MTDDEQMDERDAMTKKRRLYEARHVWIVEMWTELPMQDGYWMPTVGIGLNREQGRWVLAHWKNRYEDDKFRLVKYVKAPK